MKILHVLKTSSGGDWAARQVSELVSAGIEVHVVLPDAVGSTIPLWKKSGAKLHFAQLDFPVKQPWELAARMEQTREIVKSVAPDLIHSHFVGTTLTLRLALGKNHRIPRIFQIPGPLHLENIFFREMEILSAGLSDFWMPSSRYIYDIYKTCGVSEARLFLSYYGLQLKKETLGQNYDLRNSLGLPLQAKILTNVSHMYAPKYYLGQTVGLKCHEDLIEAFAQVTDRREDVTGLIVGGAWGKSTAYESALRKMAHRRAGARIRFLGVRPASEIPLIWSQSDLAVHVPLSENCGGVVEPLLVGTPVIASRVGGIPEVIIDHVTGDLVGARRPTELAKKILEVLEDLPNAQARALAGRELVQTKFEIKTIVRDLLGVYHRLTPNNEVELAV